MTILKTSTYDHVGIRVQDRDAAVAFYQMLGFAIEDEEGSDVELINAAGFRINLICNAVANRRGNVLLDVPVKWPGYTHVALVVSDLDEVIRFTQANNIRITEGPKVAARRRYLFFRDPDGNVIEVNELL